MKSASPLKPHARPQIFVLRGDLTQIAVDAIVYPTSASQEVQGHLSAAMLRPSLGFRQVYIDDGAPACQPLERAGQAYWVSLEEHGREQGPYGVAVTAVVDQADAAVPTEAVIAKAAGEALTVALDALEGVLRRMVLRDALTREVEQALQPVARKWRLRDVNRRAFEEVSQQVADQISERSQRQAQRRRIRVAYPALGTGSGYNREVSALSLARAQVSGILAALDRLDDELRRRVDVVLVAYNEQSYHHFLQARREALEAQWDFDEARGAFVARGDRPWLQPPVERRALEPRTVSLADAVRRGECVLFVGAGLSMGVGMKSWQHLIEALLDDLQDLAEEKGLRLPSLQHATTEDYLDIAQWHAVTRDSTRAESHEHYVNRFFGPEATAELPLSIAHFLLLSLPFQHVITTNYDNLIERTLKALRRPLSRIVRDQDVPRTGRSDEVSVVKFHGHAFSASDAARADRVKAGGTIVLTREEYDTFFNRHPAKALLLEGLLLNHHFFFVGYSLSDPDFRQIQHRVIYMLEGAQRKAYAPTLDDHRHWARAQWEDNELAQIPFHDGDTHQRIHAMWCWFDTLAELVTGSPSIFLTDHRPEQGDGSLSEIHATLVTLAEQAEQTWLRRDQLDGDQIEILARTFELLEGLGWRSDSPGRSWVKIWRALSQHRDVQSNAADRVRYLRKALSAADRSELIDELRAELAPLEAHLDDEP